MSDEVNVVAEVKRELLALGQNLSGDCGAFKITREVGYRLRADGWGYVAKNSGQTGCQYSETERYGIDSLMKKDGTTVDCLILAGSNNGDTSDPNAYNKPTWQTVGNAPVESWREPFPVGATVPIPPNPPDNGGGEEPPGDNDLKLELIIKQNNEILDKLNELRNTQMNQDPLIVATKDQVCAKGFYNNLIRDIRPK